MPECGAHAARVPGGKPTNVQLTSGASSRVLAYTGLAGPALLGGLALGRLELALLAVPVLIGIVAGVLLPREHPIEGLAVVYRSRLLEGEEAVVEVRLR